jgi:hypothetical protein
MSVIMGLATLRSIFLCSICRSQQTFSCDTVGHLVENLFHMKSTVAKNQNYFFMETWRAGTWLKFGCEMVVKILNKSAKYKRKRRKFSKQKINGHACFFINFTLERAPKSFRLGLRLLSKTVFSIPAQRWSCLSTILSTQARRHSELELGLR